MLLFNWSKFLVEKFITDGKKCIDGYDEHFETDVAPSPQHHHRDERPCHVLWCADVGARWTDDVKNVHDAIRPNLTNGKK